MSIQLCPLGGPCGELSIAGIRNKKLARQVPGLNAAPTAVYALSWLSIFFLLLLKKRFYKLAQLLEG
jgi:hypothetical protein